MKTIAFSLAIVAVLIVAGLLATGLIQAPAIEKSSGFDEESALAALENELDELGEFSDEDIEELLLLGQ